MTDMMVPNGIVGGESDERAVAKAQLEAAEEQLRSLCANHAGTFVSVERRGQTLESALRELLSSVKNVELQVSTAKHALEQEEESEKSLAALSEKHRVRRRTLLQHSSLLELLELPSLMDACVRSNLYEEALSISAFANTLERRHTEKNDVVLKVIAQIRSRQSDLRRHLLHSLKNYVTMPQCLEIVTALRRLNSIDLERQSETNLERVHAAMELSLQVDFLEARDAWLDLPSGANATSTSSSSRSSKMQVRSSEHLLDVIERYRTRVFEIATQFNAIFRAQTTPSSQQVSVSLLSMWTSRRVHSFLSMLAAQLNRMEDSASLRDAFDACVFFAASLGRLGADFTSQLPPIFERKMHDLVVQFWKEGTSQLAETLRVCREAGVASPLFSSSVDTTNASSQSETSTGDGPLPPPRQLMAHPPLARFVNSFATGLNELRRCLLPGIFSQLRKSCDELMTELEHMLQANERAALKPGLRGDAEQLRKVAAEMKQVLTSIVEPYVRGALEFALGNEQGAAQFHEMLKEAKEEEIIEEETAQEETEDTIVKKEGDEIEGGVEQEEADQEGDENEGVVEQEEPRQEEVV